MMNNGTTQQGNKTVTSYDSNNPCFKQATSCLSKAPCTNELFGELARGVAIQIPPNGINVKIGEAKREKRQLVVKLGFDPTAPDLHLGHAVVLKKMRQFQDAGLKLVVIIGDYTARIGDPTGRNKARPPLSDEKIQENSKTYTEQLSKILDLGQSKLEIRYNSEWLDKMAFKDVIKLLSKVTVAQLLQREDFNKRYNNDIPIRMHEMVYPLMQGYDSLAVNADIEVGGTDQLFNCLIGRSLQEDEGKSGQTVVSMPLLIGLDGQEKMSKSRNNYIGLTEEPNQMYGKVMSIPDSLLSNYLDLTTNLAESSAVELKQHHESGAISSMELKKMIAMNIVEQYHGEEAAKNAEAFFYDQFQRRNYIVIQYKPIDIDLIFSTASSMKLIDLCSKIQPNVSRTQVRRLISSNAVSLNGDKITDPLQEVKSPTEGDLKLRIGKRGFYSLVVHNK